MRKIAVWILALGLMATPALADGNAGTGNDSAKPATGTATDSAKPITPAKSADKKAAKASLDEELDEMRAQLRAQADQINRQEEEISAMKAQLATEAAHSNNAASEPQPSSTAAPMSVASSAPSGTAAPVTSVATASSSPASSTVSSPVTPTASASNYVAPQKSGDEPSPLFFRIGSATFTPGGFIDLTDVFRTTGTGNGIGTSFGGIPFNNNFPTAGLTENRMSMQNSRLSLRVDSDVAGGHAVGYLEVDFLGLTAQNANVTSNSNSLRSRVLPGLPEGTVGTRGRPGLDFAYAKP